MAWLQHSPALASVQRSVAAALLLTALSASFTGMHGLHESTQTLEAMKKGVNESLETLGAEGTKVQEAAIRAGYGPTVRAESVRKLVDAVVDCQERSRAIVEEMRTLSTQNEVELRGVRIDYLSLGAAAVEDLLVAECTITTLDLPQATLTRVRFEDARADEVDTRGMKADSLDLRGLAAAAFLDVGSLRGATLTPWQIGQLATAFAAAVGIDVQD